MSSEVIKIERGKKDASFKEEVMALLPDGGNLNLCLTCGLCSAGCPATGIEDMDARKFLRMASLGLDEEVLNSNWAWF